MTMIKHAIDSHPQLMFLIKQKRITMVDFAKAENQIKFSKSTLDCSLLILLV
jgi:hypothetical protein